MIKAGYIIIILLVVFLCYLITTQIKIGCEGPPLKEVGLTIGQSCDVPAISDSTVIRYTNVLEGVRFLVVASVPLSLIVIGTVLMIKAIWKATFINTQGRANYER